ncbi:MAG TPA: SpoIVB peptidase S55 domain-containing protein, partial [Candidatus Saccharimonadales bacterium]|nr:SpoIVB peptidase S55 domain-containing protein [Candidatus Saccharimonadales bacterium]
MATEAGAARPPRAAGERAERRPAGAAAARAWRAGRRRAGTAALAVAALLAAAGAARGAEPAPLRFDPATMIAAEDVRTGMRGVARTVFHGDSIEEFPVEVLSVMRHASSEGDLILVRCLGPEVEHTGVAAGMSGSPVYLEGKLAGAIALGWPFSKDPVAGVTPIAQMIRSTDAGALAAPGAARDRAAAELEPRAPAAAGRLAPLPLLAGLRGGAPGTAALAESALAGLGLVLADAGAAGRAPRSARPPALVAGSAVGVSL